MSIKLVVIADSQKAIFYQAVGLKLKELKDEFTDEALDTVHTPQPKKQGHHHGGAGSVSHTFDPHSDYKEVDRNDFSKVVVKKLEFLHQSMKFDDLIIVAEAKTLGALRSNMTSSISNLVSKEISKDLVNSTKENIENIVFSG